MRTEQSAAAAGIATRALRQVAREEGVALDLLMERVAAGRVVILKHRGRALGIGEGLRVKVNTNVGTSPDAHDPAAEVRKVLAACRHGTDTVMDLSTGGDLDAIRRKIVAASTVPVGTVPIYQAAVETIRARRRIDRMDPEQVFEAVRRHAEDGVGFVTVHCGITRRTVERLLASPRRVGVVSRGGVFTICWMLANDKENPLFAGYERLLDIARRYDLVLSLGDGLRPGGVPDSTDAAQIEELITLGELAAAARERGVQVMIEGPGHIPIHEVPANVLIEKKLCRGAPFYVLGPLVTDLAPGYDHITAAIGAAVAGWHGADFICSVSPAEHLALPTEKEVVEGLIASRIAAQAADLARGRFDITEATVRMADARVRRRWAQQEKLSLNPDRVREIRGDRRPAESDVCTMCGRYCAMKLLQRSLRKMGRRR